MSKLRPVLFALLAIGLMLLLSGCDVGVLAPKGIIAAHEKRLLIVALVLMLIIVIPTMIMTVIIAWRYRASNTKAKYAPEWTHSTKVEIVCWTLPCIIIAILATITWISSHRLDPYRPLDVQGKPLVIQVISLDWKWLFIYPDQNIATVNFLQIPIHTPVQFLITSDAPMNSLEIPQLAGQIYTMAGMQSQLHIMADEAGDFDGLSTNFSGDGFSGMKFTVRASSDHDFEQWIKSVKQSPNKLTLPVYNQLVQPSENNPVAYFSSVEKNLFKNVMMKYMMPMPEMQSTNAGHTMIQSK